MQLAWPSFIMADKMVNGLDAILQRKFKPAGKIIFEFRSYGFFDRIPTGIRARSGQVTKSALREID